jgi:hypothetical protein
MNAEDRQMNQFLDEIAACLTRVREHVYGHNLGAVILADLMDGTRTEDGHGREGREGSSAELKGRGIRTGFSPRVIGTFSEEGE